MDFIRAIENKLGKNAEIEMLPLQAGDVPDTYADVGDLISDFDYGPSTLVEDSVSSSLTGLEHSIEFKG